MAISAPERLNQALKHQSAIIEAPQQLSLCALTFTAVIEAPTV